jgi:peptide/nickel transport system permease protein
MLRRAFQSFWVKRVLRGVVTMLAVSLIVFAAARATGDPAAMLAPEDAPDAEIAAIRAHLNLDKPIMVQYVIYLDHAVKGDFGQSIRYREPALGVVLGRFPATLRLAIPAFLIAAVFGITLGVVAARRHGTGTDAAIRLLAVLGQSAPSFLIGIFAIMLAGIQLQWLPTSGAFTPAHLILPAFTLALFSLASIVRLTRSSMLETLSSEYVKFLRAKGLSNAVIVWKHALRNALIPVVAVLGIQLGHLVGGAVIIELVFNWPGVGRLIVTALENRDFPVIQAAVMLISLGVVVINLLVDLLYSVIDPRVRLS